MNKRGNYMVFLALLTAIVACRKPYTPKAILAPGSYLVVEGVINSGADSTIITLSKTINIATKDSSAFETNAQVTVENEGGTSYPLQEFKAGHYLAIALNLDKTKKYRLHIKTAGSNEYASDYVAVKPTPPIDSITYRITDKGLQVNVNTHNPANSTRYYRWAYEEAWQFHAQRNSESIVKGTDIVPRKPEEQIYYCFAGDKSSNIVLGSTEKLQQDIISQIPITIISPRSEKLQIKYSILLKQYAVTKEEYQFWENIKKNTEQLGSIFDAQPSQLKGNIHGITNPAEPVIGYIGVTNTQTKRIFITNNRFPDNYYPVYADECEVISAFFINALTGANDVDFFIFRLGYIPVSPIISPRGVTIGYKAAPIECVDCRLRGHIDAPDFWEL
ncbi:DUF4249 domain-containing protein [Mucilaginibacter sp.]|uniref:DUF4249 domain-containing protein n=1 Tax=Mucilaginibacter sp. TaxID=1882438 RepID=UPI0025EC9434|nr:DUF4249 domain-containing protein [Mucilaginibacter sp.]